MAISQRRVPEGREWEARLENPHGLDDVQLCLLVDERHRVCESTFENDLRKETTLLTKIIAK
jgi:hypothetical protein